MSEAGPGQPADAPGRLSPVERVLRVFTEVRPGEGRVALIMLANVLLILCAYYLVKPLREGWLAVSPVEGLSKMELKAYSSFGQGLVLIGVTAGYAKLVGRLPRATLISWATLFCMSNLVVFWTLQPDFFFAQLPLSGIVFYLWVGIFGVFVVAQFWAFAADLYDDERGRRIIPLIAIGATAGAVAGSWFAEALVTSGLIGTEYLLIAALVPLALSIVLTRAADRAGTREPRPVGSAAGRPQPEPAARPEGERAEGAVGLVLRDPFLLAVALVTLLLNWVNTNGENLLFQVVQTMLEADAAAAGLAIGEDAGLRFVRDATTAFYGSFFFWVNVVALLLQSLVASRLLKHGGFAAVFLLLPVISLLSYAAMALVPLLGVIKAMKVAENATDYSLNNTARHVLWLPFAGAVTFRAKPTIDSLFVRLGDGLAALTALVGVRMLAASLEGYFLLNIALVALWLGLGVWIVGRHRRICREVGVDVRT